ncbi:unnamed protein product [Orchesella dallaii]|uniref:Uncharacterized protein n=1 Tax=Orchesella dallaii TaxID=48710 RepID=A0ABP1R4P5_9HEXA
MEGNSHIHADAIKGGDIRGGDTYRDGSGDVAVTGSLPRRSSRVNFGIPPTRFGEWSTPPPHPRSQVAMPPSLLPSTIMAADGRQLTRTSCAASGEDDAASLSSHTSQASIRFAARSSRLEENQKEIQRLQNESQQLETSMKQRMIRMQNQMLLLNQENRILEQQQQLEDENHAALPFGADSANPVNMDVQMRTYLSAIIPDKRVHRFLPTPRRPTVPPPPQPTPASSAKRVGEMNGWQHGQREFAASTTSTNPPVAVKGEQRHPVPKREEKESYKPRFHGSTSRLGTPQLLGHGVKEASPQPVPTPRTEVVPAVSSEEALANALLKVLSAQSKTTEKFVARRSL